MPETRQILNWLGLLLLIAIVVPFVIYAIPGAIGAEGSYVVLSGSMEPSISTGDVVIVDGVEPADIEERDVITYRRNDADTPTTHRVVGINEEGGELSFVTQGDANDQPDSSPVPAPQVMGQVVFAIPYIGYVIEFVNTPMGFFGLVVVPFVLLLLSEVYSILAANDSGSSDEGSDEGPKETDPGSARAVSPPPVKSFVMKDPTETGSDEEETDPSVPRPADNPTTADTTRSGSAAEPAEDENASDEANVIAVTRSDLRLSLGVLTGTAIYAGWVVYNIQAAWSFAVAFGSGVGVLLVGAMYYATESGDGAETEGASGGKPESPPASEGVATARSRVRTDGAAMRPPESGPDVEKTDRRELEDTDE